MSKEKQSPEDLEKWLEEQKGECNNIMVHRETATKEEWLKLLKYLEAEDWDYDEISD